MNAVSVLVGLIASIWATTLFRPRESRVDKALYGCRVTQVAVLLYQNLDGTADVCPTVQDLVRAKKISPAMTEDPWGVPYRILCSTNEVRVFSNGADRRPGTADDLRDDFKEADIQRVKDLVE